MTGKKDDNVNADSITTDCPELESIFQFDKEQACWDNQYYEFDGEKGKEKIAYERPPNIEESHWNNFLAQVKDINTGKFFRSGEGSGACKANGSLPKRYVTSIIRLKSHTGQEYLLSNNRILAYNQWGDEVVSSASQPEKYYHTSFKFQSQPNHITGFAMRVNVGPAGGTLLYTKEFSKDAAQTLFDMRENDDIQLIVKNEPAGKSYQVKKPSATLQENFDMFVGKDFSYLFSANYLSVEAKMLNMRES